MLSGTSMAIDDILEVKERQSILDKGDVEVKKLKELYEEGMLTDDQIYQQVLKV